MNSTVRSVGLKASKNELAEYVRLAAGAETVLITDRDRVPVAPTEELLAELRTDRDTR